ncbi:uncharacterized protein [Aristolochia californica]|uniref:uncharacterized protein n=1 Tax=Aristolochia californica TaxID=171875 RepID=UPI0035DBDD6C
MGAEFLDKRYHVRSTSTPSCPHPKAEKVAETLKKLIEWNSSLCSPSFTNRKLAMFSEGLRSLSDVHESVHDLLQLGSTQKTLVHSGIEGCIEETLDGSLRLLDVCGTVKDAMSQMKMHLRDFQSALRRKGREDSDIDKKISVYFNSRKHIKKEIRNGLIAIKRAEEQWKSSLIPDKDDQLCAVISVLRKARLITVSILESLLIVISASKTTSFKHYIFQRWMDKGRVACEGQEETVNEVKKLDASLSALYSKKCGKQGEVGKLREIQNQIEELGESIQCLEDGLQGVFRCLIQTRVTLLNLLNH